MAMNMGSHGRGARRARATSKTLMEPATTRRVKATMGSCASPSGVTTSDAARLQKGVCSEKVACHGVRPDGCAADNADVSDASDASGAMSADAALRAALKLSAGTNPGRCCGVELAMERAVERVERAVEGGRAIDAKFREGTNAGRSCGVEQALEWVADNDASLRDGTSSGRSGVVVGS